MRAKKAKKMGKLRANGVFLTQREQGTVEFLLNCGEDIELIIPSYTKGNKNADLVMRGKIWEMKAPTSMNINTLEVMFKRAVKQSENLIFDLRQLRSDDTYVIKRLRRRFQESKRAKCLLIITKEGKMIEL